MLVSNLLANLALLGLAAGLPKFIDNSDASDAKPKVPIEAKNWPKYVRYANFSAASYIYPCPYPPYGTFLHQFIDVQRTDTEVAIFRDEVEKEFIVAFAGSASAEDGRLDAESYLSNYALQSFDECEDCQVHHGFQTAWKSASLPVRDALTSALKEYPEYNITTTGHSLGGALAHMSFATLRAFKFPVTASYTYGQPRVGNQNYADYVDSLSGATETKVGMMHRVTHTFDGIPQLPGLASGYQHSRTEIHEYDPAEASNTYRCFGQEAYDCSRAQGRGYVNKAHGFYSGINIGSKAACGLPGNRFD